MRILGYVFRPLDARERREFSGVGAADLIANSADGTTLIYSPETNTVSEFTAHGEQRDWSLTNGELS